MKSPYNRTFMLSNIVAAVDLLTFNLVLLLCYLLNIWPYENDHVMLLSDFFVANISYITAQYFVGITLHGRFSTPASVMRNTSRSSVLFAIVNAAILGMAHFIVPGFWRSLLVAFVVFGFTSVERLLLRNFMKKLRTEGKHNMSTIIIGYGNMVQRVASVMQDQFYGYRLLGIFADEGIDGKYNLLGRVGDVMKWLEENKVDEIYISEKVYDDEMKPLMKLCHGRMIRVFYIPGNHNTLDRKTELLEMGNAYVMARYKEPLMKMPQRIKKRLFDVIFSAVFLLLLFPWIFVIVAIITRMTMPGPIFFKQKRTGYDGKDFWCYKFRSMKVNNDSDKVQATQDDPRVTKWGHFMRHTNIDELPQFINVLMGDMSIVGPRPHMLAHTEYYSEKIGDYMIRHYVKPGITGWAQTHGERGETKTVEDMARRVEKDIWYIENWGFWLDIQIIFKTVMNVFVGDDKAY